MKKIKNAFKINSYRDINNTFKQPCINAYALPDSRLYATKVGQYTHIHDLATGRLIYSFKCKLSQVWDLWIKRIDLRETYDNIIKTDKYKNYVKISENAKWKE